MDVINQLWHRAFATQQAPSGAVCAIAAVAALALILPRPVWRFSRNLVTIAHEGAHGVVALLAGRQLAGIRVHSDSSGLTVSKGKPRGIGMIATYLAGYPGPALFGLGAAALLGAGHAVGVLWLALVLLALLLLQIRNWHGLWTVLVTAAVVFSVSWWFDAQWQSAFAYLIAWFLLIAAPRPVFELQAGRRGRHDRQSDADQLARLTGLPGIMWVGLFAFVTIGILALGTLWLTVPYRR